MTEYTLFQFRQRGWIPALEGWGKWIQTEKDGDIELLEKKRQNILSCSDSDEDWVTRR